MPSAIPATPRVISPSPTPSESTPSKDYFTRSKAKSQPPRNNVTAIEEDVQDHYEDPELARARGRSRSPQLERSPRKKTSTKMADGATSSGTSLHAATLRRKKTELQPPKATNGLLSPSSAGYGSSYWRNLSRSPSPLGLIPIHREWRAFIHKYEVPRKLLHVSIGFVALWGYHHGLQQSDIYPPLAVGMVPVVAADLVRFNWPAFNRFYIRWMGAFMRESEAHDRFNGTISYMLGILITMYFCPKDVSVMCLLLLSWCDTAASTFGRLWGKYTPRVRKGKSLAGSLAAFFTGVLAAVLFWGVVAPRGKGALTNTGLGRFAFEGHLSVPGRQEQLTGWPALAMMGVVSGIIASVSEAIDLWGLDDNLTIPVLCGLGLTLFLRYFGQ
ncbi:phosphatidate cytidylyltransferas-like protein [Piedraia hortae CBS 480.64]|uniref:Phosphatidate cytidylyltransferas-like protein n=1 Tax=Piedraia hortae CBS 480.64 TaxID=1314780 RepID=A0A6A7CAI6_9PEZI|nr:phosphatidate cytidylyltransferas-like protein [Piedraia hortae CBS 480.64]